MTHLIYVRNFSYPKNLRSTPRCPNHRGVILNVQKLRLKLKKIKTALGHHYWDQEELISEKTRTQKSCETVPLEDKK